MAKGYKVKIDAYEYKTWVEQTVEKDGKEVFDIDPETGEPKREEKTILVPVQIHLPLMLCNPQIVADPKAGVKDGGFNLYEIGVIAKKIENCKTEHITLDKEEYMILKKRMEVVAQRLSYKFFEMVRRVMEAEQVELGEVKQNG